MTSPLPHTPTNYRADIDGLRAVAVLSVVAYHAMPTTVRGGFAGVDVFFVISGFLISTILFRHLVDGRFSLTDFYARRIRRIFPALAVVLLSVGAFGTVSLLADEFATIGRHIASGAAFVSNLTLLGESGYFNTVAETKPLLHLWSLGVEEQYYIVWPLLLWLAWRSRLGLIALTVVGALASFRANLVVVHVDPISAFYLPYTRFWELLAGAALAWIDLRRQGVPIDAAHPLSAAIGAPLARVSRWLDQPAVAEAASVLGALLLTIGVWRITNKVPYPGKWALVPVTGTVFLIAAGPAAWINRRLLSHPLAVWVGMFGYPLYLWHWPLLSYTQIIDAATPSPLHRTVAVGTSILLAWLTYRFIESPFRFGRATRVAVPVLTTTMVVIGLAGYGVAAAKGFPSRLPVFIASSPDFLCPKGQLINDVCEVGRRDSPRRIVAYGDSHLDHVLIPTVRRLGADYAIDIVYASGCFMSSQFKMYVTDAFADCDRKVARLQARRGSKPAAVITGQRWHGYKIESATDVERFITDRLDALGMEPEKLIILGSTANVPFECEKSRLRPFDRLRTCQPDEPSHVINRTFIDVTSHMRVPASVSFVYPYRILCPNDICAVVDQGISRYFDFNHMSAEGAEPVAAEIESIIRR